ncbi:MAG TPA: Flp pilus assembly protein CpaB [Planctomycetota bacterium]|nr:Flp pilus assembly protein CpaB [Planctomycetota bacterium]
MSKRKPIVLLMIAAVLGLLATTATGRYIEKGGSNVAGTPIYTAAADLAPGTRITKEHLATVLWPEKVPATLFSDSAAVIEKYVSATIPTGEPIIKSKISDTGLAGDITGYIPSGYRAMAIKIDKSVKAGGLLAPGCFVDVITVITEHGREPMSKIILENIKVLSVGNRPTDEDQKEKAAADNRSEEVVTLLLLPDEAEKLALATNRGKIQLMARSAFDTSTANTSGSSAKSLLPAKPEPEKAPPKEQPKLVKPVQEGPKPEQLAERLFNEAQTLEAKGQLKEAASVYDQVAEQFASQKLAVEAVARANQIRARVEDELKGIRLGKAVDAAKEMLGKGSFEDGRRQVSKLLEDFGSMTFQGEKIEEVVSKLKLRANEDERRARAEFQVFKNWIRNNEIEKARQNLEKLKASYPESVYCKDAVKMLAEYERSQQPAEDSKAED